MFIYCYAFSQWQPPEDLHTWSLFHCVQTSLGLGGNVHQLFKPIKSPPTIYKGDTRHLDADEVPLVPPVPWRLQSESRPNHKKKTDGWPSLLTCICLLVCLLF